MDRLEQSFPGFLYFCTLSRMYLLYIDASGTPDLPGDLPTYAMIGLCFNERKWHAVQKRVDGLRRRFSLGPEAELHAKDICVEYREQSRIPEFQGLDRTVRRASIEKIRAAKLATLRGAELQRKRAFYRQTSPFIHLTRRERTSLFQSALDLVGDHDGMRLFGEIIDKRSPRFRPGGAGTGGPSPVVEHAFEQLVSRFEAFLRRQYRDTRRNEKGILVMDNEPTHAGTFAALLTKYQSDGHPWGSLDFVIEVPFFVDSASAPGIQLADLVAYSTRRYVERANADANAEEPNFLRFFRQFDREGPRLHGLRHYCERDSCRCLICSDRGHSTFGTTTVTPQLRYPPRSPHPTSIITPPDPAPP